MGIVRFLPGRTITPARWSADRRRRAAQSRNETSDKLTRFRRVRVRGPRQPLNHSTRSITTCQHVIRASIIHRHLNSTYRHTSMSWQVGQVSQVLYTHTFPLMVTADNSVARWYTRLQHYHRICSVGRTVISSTEYGSRRRRPGQTRRLICVCNL